MESNETPKQAFKTQLFGGYSKDQVLNHLRDLENEIERLKDELSSRDDRIEVLEAIAHDKMKALETYAQDQVKARDALDLDALKALEATVADQPDLDFLDLLKLDARETQTVLKHVEPGVLLFALIGEDCTDLREQIFSQVSSRASSMLREDLRVLGRIAKSRVRLARQQIVCAVLKLAAEDQIMLPGPGDA